MNVDSKGTTDHQRGFELGKLLQVHRNDAFRRGVEVQAESVAEEFGIKSPDACAERNAAEIAFGDGGESGMFKFAIYAILQEPRGVHGAEDFRDPKPEMVQKPFELELGVVRDCLAAFEKG